MSEETARETDPQSLGFLQLLELPAFNGCRLGVTATRALERYSDLLDHQQQRAPLRPAEIQDIADEFLDLVVVKPEAPAGFEFTGLSLAEFHAALNRASAPAEQLAAYRLALSTAAMAGLREAARQRIRVLCKYVWFRHLGFCLPAHRQETPCIDFPPNLAPLLIAAQPDGCWPKRSRLAVEALYSVAALQPTRIPLRGKRFPRRIKGSSWVTWWGCRLLPRRTAANAGFTYNEIKLALPGLETSFFSPHFTVRNLLAHVRYTVWNSAAGHRVMLIDELQSDWLRDLRWQRLGRERTAAWIVGTGRTPPADLPPVPACPYQDDWLTVTAEAIVTHARTLDCHVVAWTPARIQQALNPHLPLAAAERLYDRRLPAALRNVLLAQGESGLTLNVDYPCWSTDVHTVWTKGAGWRVFDRASGQPVTPPYPEWREAFAHLETVATPVMETLPGYLLC